MFECKFCKFECKYESELLRHKNSKKHKDNALKNFLCSGCFKSLSNNFSKKRHEQKCKSVQRDNPTVINNITNNVNNINQNINQNINIINISGPIDSKTSEMLITTFKQLIDKSPTTDCFQKLILRQMQTEPHDLMDCIERFDKEVEAEREKIIQEHNRGCYSYIKIKRVDENGEEYEEEIEINPITHPGRRWGCDHVKTDFKLNEDIVSDILVKVLLDEYKLVITHDNDINGQTDLLFKHLQNLYPDDILLQFIDKSNKKEYFNLSEDFQPASKIKDKYPDFYKKIEAKAIDIFRSHNKKTKMNFRR